jgi:signal transduction histidine kinase
LERLLFEEQTRALYSKGPTALVANLLVSSLLVGALWPSVSHRVAVVWLVTMSIVVTARFGLIWRFRLAGAASEETSSWYRRWLWSSALTGAIWGAGGVLLYPARSPGGQDLLMFVIGGMVAGASSSLGSRLAPFLAFTVPALLGPTVRLFLEHDRHHASMATLLIVFALGMTSVSIQGARTLAEAVRLRFKNAKLAEDLTASQRELERRVEERTKELRQTIRQRDDFVSVVSHELRSPLASMALHLEQLQQNGRRSRADPEKAQHRLGVMSRQIGRMRHIIDDLLDVTRLSTDRMRYTMELFDLRMLIDESLEELAPQLLTNHAEFRVDVDQGMSGYFDRYRIEQAIVNLLANALKYGRSPFSLSAHRIDECAHIVVHDCGVGIPREELQRIFEAFHRGPSVTAAGLGLGLFVAERIVSAHRGRIHAESSAGHGTSFIIDLPLAGKSVAPVAVPRRDLEEGATV